MIRNRKAYICIFEYPDDLDTERIGRFLSPARREKLAVITHEGAKKQSAAAELAYHAARMMAWKDVQNGEENVFIEDPAEWTNADYSYGAKGKPELPFGFMSITHTDGLAAAAFSFAPVGIDAEAYRTVSEKLAKRVLSINEYGKYLASDDRSLFLLRYWTVKESFLKLTGEGIFGGMNEVTVDMRTDSVFREQDNKSYRFSQLEFLNGTDANKRRTVVTACCPAGIEPVFMTFSDTVRLLIYINAIR